MQSPVEEPLPRVVVLTGKAIREYFEEALAEEGASLATWVVLYGVERGGWDNQRDLAKDLRVNPATVAKAYQRLTDAGILTVRRGDGTYVAESPPPVSRAERSRTLRDAAVRYASLAATLGVTPEEAAEALASAWRGLGSDPRKGARS